MTSPSPASLAAPAARRVSRAHRLLDVLSAALVLAGGGMFSVAFAGLDELHRAPETVYTAGMSIDQLARYSRLSALSWAGLGAVALGIGVGVYTWTRHRKEQSAAK